MHMRVGYLSILVLVVIISTVIQSSVLIIQLHESGSNPVSGKATNTGEVSFCLNNRPNITGTTCPNSSQENTAFTCSVIANDNDNQSLIYEVYNAAGGIPFVNNNDSTFTFYTYEDELGNYEQLLGDHTFLFGVYDQSPCENDAEFMFYDVEVYDINDPPILIHSLPNPILPTGATVEFFNLNNYFEDPENRPMTYVNSGTSSIVITILGTGQVLGFSSGCTDENVYFTAIDHGNLTTNSNTITIDVRCDSVSGEESSSSDTSSSGSGGGGGIATTCISDWMCDPWSDCSEEGVQTKNCIDRKACNQNYLTYSISRNCTYYAGLKCDEYWRCDGWSDCSSDSSRTRNCEELNGCGTVFDKPALIEECVYDPTCSDGIQNQEETAIDCGGPCLPCAQLNIPGFIKEEKTIISSIILLTVFIILSLLIMYKYFHKEINTAVAKALLNIIRKAPKRILLSDYDKKLLLDELINLEKNISGKDTKQKSMDAANIGRLYFSRIFNLKAAINKKILDEQLKNLKIEDPLDNILSSFLNKIEIYERESHHIYKTHLLTFIEELREIIHLTSKFNKKEIHKEIKELSLEKTDSNMIKFEKSIYNLYVAMHFDELEITKNKYTDIIKIYENLSEKEKSLVYEDITRLFNEVKYLISVES